MSKSVRYTLRFLVIVFVVSSLSSLVGPSPGKNSPYLSSLSELAAPSLHAQSCEFRKCRFVPNTHCHDSLIASNCTLGGPNGCTSTPC